MAKIFINGKEHDILDGQNLLKAGLSLGYNIPYFCYHPALGSVGACRLCAVNHMKDEKDTQGRLVMSCMTPAANGTRIETEHPEAKAFRAAVLEWLMANHPHDCAVCDEGGECHLQDMTVMTGHNYREYRFNKRTYRNQNLGPFINHEMNRCIQCYRCVRYYKDYAGGRDLDVFGAHDNVYFGRHEDGTLENAFSGNLVEVCPTGVFTDKTLKKQYIRKWDLTSAPSVCHGCAAGCNTLPGERYGKLVRVLNRYNGDVNGYFLCDRGRFGYEYVNGPQRLRRVFRKAEALDRETGLSEARALLQEPKPLGIGSPRASLESNFALRTLVGPDNFYAGVSTRDFELTQLALDILTKGPSRAPSLRDIEQCDAVLVLGEDVTNTAPRVALALRQAARRQPVEEAKKLGIAEWNDAAVREVIQQKTGPFFIAAPSATPLDDAAQEIFRGAPEDIARLGFAVARELDNSFPEVPGLSDAAKNFAATAAEALKAAKRPLVVSGTGLGSRPVLEAAANAAWALKAELFLCFPEANSVGLALLGAKPLSDGLSRKDETVVVLENDLYRRADAAAVDKFLDGAKSVLVLDHTATRTTAKANVTLPAATFVEGDGTLVSSEGRAQRSFQVYAPKDDALESWRWIAALSDALSGWKILDDVLTSLAQAVPLLAPAAEAAPHADFRVAGQKIARQSHRATGRTAITADVTVHEPKPAQDADAPLSFTMEGYGGPRAPGALVSRFWAPGWNSVQSLNKFQSEVGGPLLGGNPGKRLIEPGNGGAAPFKTVPAAYAPKAGEWRAVPFHHIFGSEEMSALSPAVAERAPKPYAALNPADMQTAGLKEGGTALVSGQRLPVKADKLLAAGTVGLPVGLVPPALFDGAVKISGAGA